LIGVERNALTYAGHTTWNKMLQRGTHAALITDEEAELVLAGVKARGDRRDRDAAICFPAYSSRPTAAAGMATATAAIARRAARRAPRRSSARSSRRSPAT
jgi:topoisomerase IA-like protein